MSALLRAAYQCATAGLILLAVSLVAGAPGWLTDTALALLAASGWNSALAGWFAIRETWREQYQLEGWTAERPVRVGTCSVHGTVWSGPGYSTFRAFADHGPCVLRDYERSGGLERARMIAAMARHIEEEGQLPLGLGEDGRVIRVPGPLLPVTWQQVPREPATEVRYHDAGNGMRDAEVIIHVELYPGAGRCTCEAGADCRWWRFGRAPKAVLVTGMVEPMLELARLSPLDPLPGTTTIAALADRLERLGMILTGLAGKMAPGHMPECDCSECD